MHPEIAIFKSFLANIKASTIINLKVFTMDVSKMSREHENVRGEINLVTVTEAKWDETNVTIFLMREP